MAALLVIIIVALAIWLISVASDDNSDPSADIIDTYSECVASRSSDVDEEAGTCVTSGGLNFSDPSRPYVDSTNGDDSDSVDEDDDDDEVGSKTFSESSYMTISQWDVKGPLDFEVLGSVSYSITGEVLTLRSTKLDEILPSPCENVGPESWGVRRSSSDVSGKKIGDYYYFQIYPSAGCSVKKDQLEPINQALKDFYDYLVEA